MITRQELEEAIAECKEGRVSYQSCAKLATFFTIMDHLYPEDTGEKQIKFTSSEVIGDYGESEFLKSVSGKDSFGVWIVMDELMSTIKAINPRLYSGALQKINQVI